MSSSSCESCAHRQVSLFQQSLLVPLHTVLGSSWEQAWFRPLTEVPEMHTLASLVSTWRGMPETRQFQRIALVTSSLFLLGA